MIYRQGHTKWLRPISTSLSGEFSKSEQLYLFRNLKNGIVILDEMELQMRNNDSEFDVNSNLYYNSIICCSTSYTMLLKDQYWIRRDFSSFWDSLKRYARVKQLNLRLASCESMNYLTYACVFLS